MMMTMTMKTMIMMTMMTTRFELSLYNKARAVTGDEHSEEPSLEKQKIKNVDCRITATPPDTQKTIKRTKNKTKPENAVA